MPIRAFLFGENMKYQVGELVLVKNIRPLPLLHPRPLPRPLPLPRLRPRLLPRPLLLLRLHLRLNNTYGIITEVEKHSEIFKENSTENDNGYIWYSQVDGKEYYFYEDEVDGEVFK
jgi:hypothetical protein